MKGAGGGVCQRWEELQLRLLRYPVLDPNQPSHPNRLTPAAAPLLPQPPASLPQAGACHPRDLLLSETTQNVILPCSDPLARQSHYHHRAGQHSSSLARLTQ